MVSHTSTNTMQAYPMAMVRTQLRNRHHPMDVKYSTYTELAISPTFRISFLSARLLPVDAGGLGMDTH